MKTLRLALSFLLVSFVAGPLASLPVWSQTPPPGPDQPTFTPEQRRALTALSEYGGIVIRLDDERPGKPVVAVDFASHPEFQDEWTGLLLPFSELREVDLAGTKLTDAGLSTLAGCQHLKSLNVQRTSVSLAGVTALRRKLPQLTIIGEPGEPSATPGSTKARADKPTVATNRSQPPGDSPPRVPPTGRPDQGGATTFTAADIQRWREAVTEISRLPLTTPNGWSKSRVDPAKLLTVFPELSLREGYVLRAYVFKEDGNSNGFVWALPADADYPAPEECPRIESHFLNPPKPFDALDDFMDAITGDGSPQSYLHASILRRELKEFAGGWHGIEWGTHSVLDDSPWNHPAGDEGEATTRYPDSRPAEWKWFAPRPESWKPEVQLGKDRVVVTFYSYTGLLRVLENGQDEKERIIRHVETYRRGKYRPLIAEQKLAEGPRAYAH